MSGLPDLPCGHGDLAPVISEAPLRTHTAPVEVSSPVCYAAEAGDAYLGFLDRDTLIAELNILLEAERAGARVAAHLVADARRLELKSLGEKIRNDEYRWCKMLAGALRTLQATPSDAVGGFYDQAMAISDVEARFVFVNRGQAWVVRKLKAIIPKVRDDQLHGELLRMLAGHHHNIMEAESTLAGVAKARARSGAPAPRSRS